MAKSAFWQPPCRGRHRFEEDFTVEELARYSGSDSETPMADGSNLIYVAIKGMWSLE